MNKNYLIVVIACAIIGALGFYGGSSYAKSRMPTGLGGDRAAAQGNFRGGNGSFPSGQNGGFQGNRAGGFGGGVTGSIVAQDDTSITVELRAPEGGEVAGSRVILLGEGTRILQTTEGTLEDLANGTEVTVMGTPNDDGSITASVVQLRPEGLIPGSAPGFFRGNTQAGE